MHSQTPCIMQRSHHRRHLLLSSLMGMHQLHLNPTLSEGVGQPGILWPEKGVTHSVPSLWPVLARRGAAA